MDLSVIIVNWNTGDLLAQCVASLFDALPPINMEIFIVDNASTDQSMATTLDRFPQVRAIQNEVNVGFAAANNQALRRSSGEFLLLLNPDTIIQLGALKILLQFLDQHPETGAAGARLLNPDGSLQPSCSPEPTLRTEFLRLFHLGGIRPDGYHFMENWDISSPRQVDILMGACIMVRREVLNDVGLLDEDYFMYSEEVDYCRRLRKAGWDIYWVPKAQVIHFGGQSTQQAVTKMFLCLYQGKIKYFRKHYGRWHTLLYKLILFATGSVRLAVIPVAKLQNPSEFQTYKALASNYRHLLMALPGL